VKIPATSLVLAALFSASTGWASTVFDTLNIPQITSEVLNGNSIDGWAQSFQAGPEDVQLDNVVLKITSAGTGTLSVSIFDGSGQTPGSLLTTLNGPSNAGGLISFVPQAQFTLLADTTYWIVVQAFNEPPSDPGYFWAQGTGAATTGTAVATALHASGSWSAFKEGGIVTETEPMMMQVNGSSVAVPTSLAFIAGPRASDFDDPVQVQALLTVASSGDSVPNDLVTFMLASGAGAETCSATTDASGIATCMITPNQAAGAYTLNAFFVGNTSYAASSSSVTFVITHEETATALTANSATVIANGHSATLSATLKEDGTIPVGGRTITFMLGTDGAGQTCAGTTNADGLATCTIPVVNQPLGLNTVSASFAGDDYYSLSSDSESVTAFEFLPSSFYTLSPCRLLDTRIPAQGPAISDGSSREITFAGNCGIPSTATAVSLNLTIVNPSGAGYLALYPEIGVAPSTSTINFRAGQARANNAVMALNQSVMTVFCAIPSGGSVDYIIDVNGYFQ
jgi:hypothetical protein